MIVALVKEEVLNLDKGVNMINASNFDDLVRSYFDNWVKKKYGSSSDSKKVHEIILKDITIANIIDCKKLKKNKKKDLTAIMIRIPQFFIDELQRIIHKIKWKITRHHH